MKHTNTVKAHELIHYAKAHGRQLEMKERLLKAYFVNGEHVGRIEDLADIAAELGFDRADVVRALSTDEYLPAVRADQAQAIEYGIQGVPFFVIDGKYGVSGAQDATVVRPGPHPGRRREGRRLMDTASSRSATPTAAACEDDTCETRPPLSDGHRQRPRRRRRLLSSAGQ